MRGVKPGRDTEKRHARKEYGPDRVCPDCGAILSKYNKGPLCYVHSPMKYRLARGVRSDSWENNADS